MQRIDTSRAVASRPVADAGAAAPGFFSPGNPTLGQLATELSAEWCNSIQESPMRVIEAAGITPVKGQLGDTNLLEAIKKIHGVLTAMYQPQAGFFPEFNQQYNYTLTFTPEFPCMVRAAAWVNMADVQPKQAAPAWSVYIGLYVNGILMQALNNTVGGRIEALASISANVQCTVTLAVVTAAPPTQYHEIQPGVSYEAFPWGRIL